MPLSGDRRAAVVHWLFRLCMISVTCTMVGWAWIIYRNISLSEANNIRSPEPRWIFTTKAHLTFWGLLAGLPLFRDDIRSTLLGPEHVYLAVLLGRSGLLLSPVGEVQFLALDRSRGHLVWEQRLSFNGYHIGSQLVWVNGKLIAALYDENKREIVIIGMDATNGSVIWRTTFPQVKGPEPALVGDEVILVPDPKRLAVAVYFYRTKLGKRIMLRATDGQRVAENSYNGYFWRTGAHQVAGFVLGYDGRVPDEYDRLLVFQEQSGRLGWSLPLSQHWTSPPTAADDSLLITNDDRLLRLDLPTGKPRWSASLGGRVPPTPGAPVVVGSTVAVAHQVTSDPNDKQWKLSIYQLSDGHLERGVALGKVDYPSDLRQMGDLLIVGSDFMLQVVNSQNARILATLDFEGKFSRFVYADPPSMRIGDSDAQGFVVVTTDGQLRYFSAADFSSPAPRPAR